MGEERREADGRWSGRALQPLHVKRQPCPTVTVTVTRQANNAAWRRRLTGGGGDDVGETGEGGGAAAREDDDFEGEDEQAGEL
jgi:hypothetical protein